MTEWDEATPGAYWSIATTGDDILFPALGKRTSTSAALSFLGSQAQANLWSASRSSRTAANVMHITPTWYYYDSEALAAGLSIRPVAE